MKIIYRKPCIGEEICLRMDADIQATSVVDSMNVTSTGQEVTTSDFSDSSFNADWEN